MPRQTNLLPDDDLKKPYSLDVEPQPNGSLELDWATIDYQCEGYKVYRSSTEGGTFELIATTTDPRSTLYEDANVVVGQTYYYKVTAHEGGRESERSNTGSAKMVSLVVPEPPTNVNATVSAGGSSIHVTWDAGLNADIYEVERRTEEGIFRDVTLTAATETGDSRVRYSKSYYYRVRSVSSDGEESSWTETEEPALVIDTVPPSQPTGFTVVSNQDSLELFWQPPNDEDLAGFRIYRSREGSEEYNVVNTINGPNVQNWKDTSVSRGETWRYRISAVDREGNESLRTVSFAGTPTNQAPLKPQLSYSLNSNDLPSIRYSILGEYPSDIDSVVFQRRLKDGSWAQIADIGISGPGTFNDDTAETETEYQYRAEYHDTGGLSSGWSSLLDVYTSSTLPDQPTNVTATSDQYGWVDLTWTDPANTTVESVRVQRSTNPNSGFSQIAEVAGDTQHFHDTNTETGVTYYYRLVVVNAQGRLSPTTSYVSVIPQGSRVPVAPSNVLATYQESAGSVEVTWDYPADAPVPAGYKVLRSETQGSGYTEVGQVSEKTYTDSTISAGTTYYYVVRSHDEAGTESSNSNEFQVTPS